MDAVEWKYEQRPGMPPEKRGHYLGFDANHAGYIMRWVENDGGNWVALGFDLNGEPIFYILRDENAALIKSHAPLPLRWTDLGHPPPAELSTHDKGLWRAGARHA